MSTLTQSVFYAVVLVLGGAALFKASTWLIATLRSPLLMLRGPPNKSWLLGHQRDVHELDEDETRSKWSNDYGPALLYRGFFSEPRMLTTDTRAIKHILTHPAEYYKSQQARRTLSSLIGQSSVLVIEGEQHCRQRRIMNPAFGPLCVRELTDVFLEKSIELCDVWAAEFSTQGETARVNVLQGLSKMTLDVIGLVGFNYEFNSLNPKGEPNELAKAFEQVFEVPEKIPILMILRTFLPALNFLKNDHIRRVEKAQGVMRRIGQQFIAQKKEEILRLASEKNSSSAKGKGLQGRDLLTLLLKANMATDVPENQRLSDEEVLSQIPTFLVAGHETTSTATAWCLYALAQASNVQKKLREELLSVETDTPTMDELMALPYLDAVIRESLRVYPPVPRTIRVAQKDDIIPLSAPITDRYRNVHDYIPVPSGTPILISILAVNRDKTLWGKDADEFRPERWENPPAAISSIPGVWGHTLSFLGGPSACIGYRFALVEMKVLLFTLVRAFEFDLAVLPQDIKKGLGIVQQPILRSDPKAGSQMPLFIRRVGRA
ncbi:cytochrome P450 [Trametes gibbosa]|nr:cytochrome P450 [Trametes gibbosa]